MKFPKPNTPAQQREAIVQERNLYTNCFKIHEAEHVSVTLQNDCSRAKPVARTGFGILSAWASVCLPYFNRFVAGCCVIIVTIFFISSVIFAQTLRFVPPVVPQKQPSAQAPLTGNSDFSGLLPSSKLNRDNPSGLYNKVVPLPPIAGDDVYSIEGVRVPTHKNQLPYESSPSGVSSSRQFAPPPLLSPALIPHPDSQTNLRNPLPLPVPAGVEKLDSIIRNGELLESECRWADALTHYEGGLQIYRNNNLLLQRFLVARFHYDVRRRCEDASYMRCIKSAGLVDAIALHDEIVTRIQTSYVDVPDWDTIFRNGLRDVSIALSDANFRLKSNLNVQPEKIDDCIAALQKAADGWSISNREDLKNGVLRLAEIGLQQINLNPVILLMEFTCGIVNSLDPYTTYLTPNQLNDTYSMISGNFVGLGVELKSDRESLMIVRVISGSPAKEAGLIDGDRIHSVDGITTRGKDTDTAANLLQGQEGTFTDLVVQTAGAGVRKVKVLRRRIEVPSVEDVRMLNREVGYVKLTGFQTRTVDELRRAISGLEVLGMRCLVLDLRHNPGGLLQMGVEVANLFIDEGVIVRTRGRQGTVETPYMATNANTLKMPLILLIDEASASASEIVAGAIKDHRRGVLVGKRSYGKGTIQAILPVNGSNPNAQAGLRITVEKFHSPQGVAYSGVGVAPDVPVETEQRITVARLVDGKLQIPVNVRAISGATDDPFVKEAMKISQKIINVP
ncbi:MAG: S41 family peptidase [Planctomycetaceae bacterium]|nr:S41 family peptidase [Planctomycetaceae bacterium]